jgi:hypothetical protein
MESLPIEEFKCVYQAMPSMSTPVLGVEQMFHCDHSMELTKDGMEKIKAIM